MATVMGPSKREINRAGDWLRYWLDAPADELDRDPRTLQAASMMLAYRETFQAPLKKVTVGVRQFVQRETRHPVVVGQRLKRAPQIVLKLSRHPKMKLARMQDIGGCRAILGGGAPEVEGVRRRIGKRWDVRNVDDYMTSPAPTGYRAIHVVVLRDERLIEIQLRTPRQHEWAEAVERTGLRLRMDLKAGQGPDDLLEYFRMAAHGLALEERGESVDEDFQEAFMAQREQVRHYFARES